MNTVTQLIGSIFEGGIAAVQGLGGMINTAFMTMLYGLVENEEGVLVYGTTYTELAQFLFTIAGVGIGIGAVYFFLRLFKRRGA